MMLPLLLLVLFLSGLFALIGPKNPLVPKLITMTGILLALCLTASLNGNMVGQESISNYWLVEWQVDWIKAWGISFHLGIDGFSWWLIGLTLVMGITASAYAQPSSGANAYYASISWTILGVVGLFMAADLFLFFIFWELSLLPVYWMILVHGQEQRRSASLRYILYTQASGLILLLAVIGLAWAHFKTTGLLSFDYAQVVSASLDTSFQHYLFPMFLLAFLIKLPAFPFHGWLPALFQEAPVPIILVGVLVKTAVFGLVRFSWPLFPEACASLALPLMLLGVLSIIYGAVVAFSQRDPRRMLAYGTLSHVGMLLIGIFCHNQPSFLGVLVLLICQALSTGGSLMMIGHLSPIDLHHSHGLWHKSPPFAVTLLIFLLAGLGFPFFGNFIGEWLVLWGTFASTPLVSALAALGMISGAIYSLWLFQKLCWGSASTTNISTISRSQSLIYGLMLLTLLAIGFYPSLIINSLSTSSYSHLQHYLEPGPTDLPNPQVALP